MKPYGLFSRYALVITLCVGGGFESDAAADSRGTAILLAAAITNTPQQPRTNFGQSSDLVRTIQDELSKQGYFLGAVDGIYGPETERAIRAYQKSSNLPVDGKPSKSLADNLETGGKVGDLLKKLEDAQKKSMKKAELALLSRPETRNLIEGKVSEISTDQHNWDECIK
ncbi:MAG: peptidoglycan-binding protein, partial [Rhodospirillaceae bacterium]|nr:peptidoglycan-binding protein [Rhodospirillaceae bacterium]